MLRPVPNWSRRSDRQSTAPRPSVSTLTDAIRLRDRNSCTGADELFRGGMESAVTPPVAPEAPLAPAVRAAGTLPEGVREGNENLVLLTPAAGAKVGALVAREKQGDFLRIAISGGG